MDIVNAKDLRRARKGTRKVKSATTYDGAVLPAWSRFLVMICYIRALCQPGQYLTPNQAFSRREDAERWARACAARLPVTHTDSGPEWWVLVCALDGGRRSPTTGIVRRQWHCYQAIDGGGSVVKNHQILPGYGVPEVTS